MDERCPFAEPRLEQWTFPILGIKQGWREGDDGLAPNLARLFCQVATRGSGTTPIMWPSSHIRTACSGDAEFEKSFEDSGSHAVTLKSRLSR